jgi:hypothetical protein
MRRIFIGSRVILEVLLEVMAQGSDLSCFEIDEIAGRVGGIRQVVPAPALCAGARVSQIEHTRHRVGAFLHIEISQVHVRSEAGRGKRETLHL